MNTATELLRRALDALVEEAQYHNDIMLRWHDVFFDIRAFLAAEQEGEPVGYAVKMIPRGLHFIGFVGEEETDEEIEEYGWDQIVPLYTNPSPARKPMTEEEIKTGHKDSNCYVLSCIDPLCNFSSGIRFAEKHHGIGGEDE
jgi:hypothetical protein